MFAKSGQQLCLKGETAPGWGEQEVGSPHGGGLFGFTLKIIPNAFFIPIFAAKKMTDVHGDVQRAL